MELINKTGITQELNLIKESLKVKAGNSVKIDVKEIYSHELERAEKFFQIKKTEPVKVKKPAKVEKEKEIFEGGK